MATQKGTKGAVFGIPGTTSLAYVVGVTTYTHEVIRTYNYSKESDDKTIAGLTGDVVNRTFFNARERLTVDIVVTDGTSMANALTDFNTLPAIGTDVTLTSTLGDTQAAASTLQWIVESASKSATCDDFATISLGLVRYAADLNTIES